MSQEMLSWHLWGLILDSHCQFASARIKLLFPVVTFTTESTYHCTFLSPPPFLFFFIDLWGPSQLSSLPPKTKQNKNKEPGVCSRPNNPLTYTVSTANTHPGMPAKQEASPVRALTHTASQLPKNCLCVNQWIPV